MEHETFVRPNAEFRQFLDSNRIGKDPTPVIETTGALMINDLQARYAEWPETAMRRLSQQVLHTFTNFSPNEPGIESLQVLAYVLQHLPHLMQGDLQQGISSYFEEAANGNPGSIVMQAKAKYLILQEYLNKQEDRQ